MQSESYFEKRAGSMNKLLQNTILIYLFFAVFYQACDRDAETIREKPVTITKVKARIDSTGYSTPIIQHEWDRAVIISGPGTFISAVVSKKGSSGASATSKINTTINLTLDRCEVILKSFEVAQAMNLTGQNYSGVDWRQGAGAIETMVLGYQKPLYFTRDLVLSILVDDPQVEKVFLQVTYTKQDTGEDEGSGGGDRAPPFP